MQKVKSCRCHIYSAPAVNSNLPHEFAFEPITEDFVLLQHKQLKTNKAIGLDNISARLLKDSASVISASLTRLFNFRPGNSPFSFSLEIWKSGSVIQER